MHSGLRFAFPRSYNLPPPSLVTTLICLYSGAALVITQQEWPSKDNNKYHRIKKDSRDKREGPTWYAQVPRLLKGTLISATINHHRPSTNATDQSSKSRSIAIGPGHPHVNQSITLAPMIATKHEQQPANPKMAWIHKYRAQVGTDAWVGHRASTRRAPHQYNHGHVP